MTAFGWISTGLRFPLLAALGRRRTRKPLARKPLSRTTAPRLESLESIELMSHTPFSVAHHHALLHPKAVARPTAEVVPFTSQSLTLNAAPVNTATQMTVLQTVTVPENLTNFSLPFAPPINKFDPNLGTLVAVHVTITPTITSVISAQNTSPNGSAPLTGLTTGNFTVSGIGNPVTGNLNGTTNTVNVPALGSVTFPPLQLTTTQTVNVTDPAQLAAFIATPGNTTITPTLTENAQSIAQGPPGNTSYSVRTTGAGVITVSYEYIPQAPPIISLVRFGIHHQPTQLVLTFGGPLIPADASNPANYVVLKPNHLGSFSGPGVKVIPVVSAVYNPDTFQVTLTTAHQLNVHHLFVLQVTLPQNNGNPVFVEFGTKKSLGGFSYHGQHFVVVNGRAFPG